MTEPPRDHDGVWTLKDTTRVRDEAADALDTQSKLLAEVREALQGLHDNCEEYVRINNLHNADGSPASDHAMRHAAAVLAKLKAAEKE